MLDLTSAPVQFVLRWVADTHPLMMLFTAYAAGLLAFVVVAFLIKPYRRPYPRHAAGLLASVILSSAIRIAFHIPNHTWVLAHVLITLAVLLIVGVFLVRRPAP